MLAKKSKLLYPLRVIAQLYRLPRYTEFFEARDAQLSRDVTDLHAKVNTLLSDLSNTQKNLADNLTALESIDARIVNLQYRFEKLKEPAGSGSPIVRVNDTVSDNHDFDYFYKLFEDRFRGTEDIIKTRVAEHLPHFKALPGKLQKLPIIDIGCGRGEFLSVLKDSKLHGIGVDMNSSMVERTKALGLEAVENDAYTYLLDKKTDSFAAIAGFHIVEHIPFEILMKIFEQCYRTIAPGGFALFETPNPQALSVGANTFYLDPSHQRPIPPQLLAFMLESVGFKPEIVTLHRVKPAVKHKDPVVDDLYESLYGAADYAVIARKRK